MATLPQPGILLTLATFAVVIGVLVFIHEMGHYVAGRLFGVKADAFSIGFGRELAGWTDARGTRWKIGAFPLGGYVKFVGDADASSQAATIATDVPAAERAAMFQFRPLWQRALIILAGPLINFAFAVVVFAGFFMLYGHAVTPPVVARVVAGSPAAQAGLRAGDRVVALDHVRIDRFEDIVRTVTVSTGTPIAADIVRAGRPLAVTITPQVVSATDRFGNRYTQGMLGIASGGRVLESRGPVAAVGDALVEVGTLTRTMAGGIVEIVTGRRSADELGGPIKIAQLSGQQAALGLPNLIEFMALISINLGFINLLPVPMLDGGHLFLYAIEAVRRRPLAPKLQELAFMSGFAALMSLMVFLTWHDLAGLLG